jgi:hypothetical protein
MSQNNNNNNTNQPKPKTSTPKSKLSKSEPTPKKPLNDPSYKRTKTTYAHKAKFGGSKNTGKATAGLLRAVADFTAQTAAGFERSDPGANKTKDVECIEKADKAEKSYINDEPCPDKTCQSKECKGHPQDTKVSEEKPDAEPSPKPENGPGCPGYQYPPDAPVSVPDSIPWDGSLPEDPYFHYGRPYFSRLVPNQVSIWIGIVLALAVMTAYAGMAMWWTTGFHIDEYEPAKFANCTEWAPMYNASETFWQNVVAYPSRALLEVKRVWCIFNNWGDNHLITGLVAVHRWYNEYEDDDTLLELPIRLEMTLSIESYVLCSLFLLMVAALAINSLLYHKILEVRLRHWAWSLLVLLALMYLLDLKYHEHPEVKRVDMCPECSAFIIASQLTYSFDYVVRLIMCSMIVFLTLCVGPNYRVYYIYRMFESPSEHKNKVDTNKRGDKSSAQAPKMAYVDTHLTAMWSYSAPTEYDTPWSPWRRDRVLVSVELLLQSCNPNSLSPVIDDSLALERINRSAINNQNVNIDKNILTTHHTNVYENTVRLAVEFRKSLIEKACMLSDYGRLNPP